MNLDTLDDLIHQLLDGCIAPEDLRRLEEKLAASPKARARYHAFVDLENLLQLQADVGMCEVENGEAMDFVMHRQRRRAVTSSLFAAAALLMIVGIALKLVMVRNEPPDLAFTASPGTRFTVIHSSGADAPPGNLMVPGSRLKIDQGAIRMELGNGVLGVLVAPADVTLGAKDRLHLNKGTAWFQVPERAIGFRVTTSQIDVVDLGTEFGILARKGELDEVHVLEGAVRAAALHGRKSMETLAAGQARRVDPIGRFEEIPVSAGSFLDSLPDSLPHLHWSFDGIEGDRLATGGTFPAVSSVKATLASPDPASRLVPGRHGKALSLDGKGDHVIADWPGFAGDRPRSVSLWVRLDPDGNYEAKTGLVGWGNEAEGRLNAKWKLIVIRPHPGEPAIFRVSWGAAWLDGATDLADGRWRHLVATTNGRIRPDGYPEAELYVDGLPEPARYHRNPGQHELPEIDTQIHNNDSVPLILGASLSPSPSERLHFKGAIDELYVFDGHLGEEDVLRLHAH